ncbi:MAG: AEC family transporter [Lachnospiraceae bacterium]|nr:AEC family transporter [Lachnospiraceae bacterium]
MGEHFLFSLNATMPIFLMILLGGVLKKIGIINDEFVKVANRYVFRVALPVMLFKEIAFSDLMQDVTAKFILYCMIVTVLMFLGLWLIAALFIKDKHSVGAFAQAGARSSAAILGVAFVENICGSAGMAPLMIVSAVPLFNILSVIILTFSAAGEEKQKESFGKVVLKSLKGIVTNPIIIGIFVGMIFAALPVTMPVIGQKFIGLTAQTATPVALIAIGGGFEWKAAKSKLGLSAVAAVIKLMILPAVFLPFAYLLGFAPSEMVAVLIMLASPTTVSCYVMARSMGNDEVLTSNVIVLTTMFSSVTLTIWIWLLRSAGLI